MAAYSQLDSFMKLVREANPDYERSKNSSLHRLVEILSDNAGTGQQVCNEIAALPVDKTKKYLEPLYYLLATYPRLPANAAPGLPANAGSYLQLGPLNQTEAFQYTKAAMPGNFNPDGQQANRVFVTARTINPTGLTSEQYLINTKEHPRSPDPPVGRKDGWDGPVVRGTLHAGAHQVGPAGRPAVRSVR